MVWGIIQTFRSSLKYRGGWKGLLEHMYTVRIIFPSLSYNFGIPRRDAPTAPPLINEVLRVLPF
jgi:hypothetical protein